MRDDRGVSLCPIPTPTEPELACDARDLVRITTPKLTEVGVSDPFEDFEVRLPSSMAELFESRVLGQDGRTKTGKSRRDVVLHEDVVRVLRDRLPTHPAHDDFLFTTPSGAPIDQGNFYRRKWVPMLRRLGIRPRPSYNTRHTYLTVMFAIGARPLWVARQTGTSLEMIEQHYGDVRMSHAELDAPVPSARDRETGNPRRRGSQ